jgi:vancomycin resistance protein VanJ
MRVSSVTVTTLLLVLGVVGHVVRDRTVWLAPLMYIPILPVALWAVLQDVLYRGRSLPVRRPPFALGFMAVVGAVLSAVEMTGGRPDPLPSGARQVTVLHWNVLWGGRGGGETWEPIVSAIAGRAPDLVVLSEAPPAPMVERLRARLGPAWSAVRWEDMSQPRYRYHMVVLSRWPLRADNRHDITDGKAMTVSAMTDAGVLRVLAVDGKSDWHLSRTPRLHDIAGICDSARQSGRPIDIIAGDFNCVGRSIGFDAFEEGGYTLASRGSSEWRGTWPAPLPLYDLDHVWVRRERPVGECDLFGSRYTDHRGQVVRISVAPPRVE